MLNAYFIIKNENKKFFLNLPNFETGSETGSL